jgi:predicted short-subunit dehydrogenase-like oxidoreductase (DUF2520 family)
MNSVSIIGVGRVGGAIALALYDQGYVIENLIARNFTNTKSISKKLSDKTEVKSLDEIKSFSSQIIFITTQDNEIEKIVDQLLTKSLPEKTYIFHSSGSLSSEILYPLKNKGCSVGSIHPLVSISDSHLGVKRFRDAFFCLEGDEETLPISEKIVKAFGGKPFYLETKYKALYHASAVVACGHLVALIDVSMEMLAKCGLDADVSKNILMPLVKSTIQNLEIQKNNEALTGTFARADTETFDKHLSAINEYSSKDILEIYLILGERSLELAKELGIDQAKADLMSKKISLAKNNLKC